MRQLLPFTIVTALVVTLSAAAMPGPGNAPGSRAGGLALSGHVAGLMPGQQARMTIYVRNRLRRVVHLRSVKTTVQAAAHGCSGKNLVVAPYRGRLRIGPGRSARVSVRVRMRFDSPDACQGELFPLTFTGQASA